MQFLRKLSLGYEDPIRFRVAGYKNRDIHFIFESIYDEPGGDWGWYTTNPNIAGRQIELIRSKALNRYSKDKLIQLSICTDKCGCV